MIAAPEDTAAEDATFGLSDAGAASSDCVETVLYGTKPDTTKPPPSCGPLVTLPPIAPIRSRMPISP